MVNLCTEQLQKQKRNSTVRRCDVSRMLTSSLPLLLLALSPVLCAPTQFDGYTEVVVPEKRAALVLDRLLIALQRALRDGEGGGRADTPPPRTAPLRGARLDDMMTLGAQPAPALVSRLYEEPRIAPLRSEGLADDTSALQRRGQGGARGRVVRCYFNAITCF